MKQNGELIFTGGMQYHYSDKYFPYSGIWLYGVCLGGFAGYGVAMLLSYL